MCVCVCVWGGGGGGGEEGEKKRECKELQNAHTYMCSYIKTRPLQHPRKAKKHFVVTANVIRPETSFRLFGPLLKKNCCLDKIN